ncbi:MAG: hypothetical protein V4858_04535 [Pseudomonadota bacterium]
MKNAVQLAIAAAFLVTAFAGISYSSPASAAQSCTAKCAEEEAACIKRTNNKGQCGDKAKQCTSKCK